jgi:hypothetical protein
MPFAVFTHVSVQYGLLKVAYLLQTAAPLVLATLIVIGRN